MLKITWRYITSNKKSTMITIMGIAFSVMLMFSLIQMGDCVRAKFVETTMAGMKRDFTVYDLSYEQIVEVEKLLESEQADGFMSLIYAGTDFSNGMKGTDLFGLHGDAEYFKNTVILEGNYPVNDYEICLEEGYNSSLTTPYQVGDTMTLTICDSESGKELVKEFRVSGILKNFVGEDYHLWTTLQTAEGIRKEFGDANCSSNSVAVVMKKSEYDVDRMIAVDEKLAMIIDDFYIKHLLRNEEKDSVYMEENSYAVYTQTLKSLTIILGICMILFIYNTYNIGVLRKIHQFGTMRSLGVSRAMQNRIILNEGLIVGHIGIGIGILLGNGLNYLVAEKLINALMMSNDQILIHQTLVSYVETYLLAIASIFLGMWKIIHNCKKLTISQMLQITEQNGNRRSKAVNQSAKTGGMLWNIAERNLRRNKSKSLSLMVTMFVSICLCILIFNSIAAGISIYKTNGAEKFFRYRIFSYTLDEAYISLDDIARVGELVGNENIATSHLSREWEGKLLNQDAHTYMLLYDDNLFGIMLESLGIEGMDFKEEPYSVFYTEDGSGAEVIQFTHIETGEQMEVPVFLTVSEGEVFQQGDHDNFKQVLIINNKMAEQLHFGVQGCSTLWITKNSQTAGIGEEKVLQCIQEERIYLDNLNKNEEANLRQLWAMAALAAYIMANTVLLTGIILSNTIQANMINRRKEFGIMRALGLTKRKSILICCMENGVLFVLAYILAAVLAAVILLYLGAQLENGLALSPIVYIGTAVFFAGIVEGISIRHMRKGLDGVIAENMREE